MIPLIRLSLEVLPERYTSQWAKWLPREFIREGFDYQEIPGQQLTTEVETGKVLDASGTMYYKFSQLQRVAQLFKNGSIKNGTVFFVDDIQYPGIWSIKYMAELHNVKVKIYGFLHASSYTREDFAEPMSPFMESVENSWVHTYDKIFVATEYHKNIFINRRLHYVGDEESKIVVTGAPWNVWSAQELAFRNPSYENLSLNKTKKQIIFTNRFDIEKRPNVFLGIIDYLYNVLKLDYNFVITTSRKKLTSDKKLLNQLNRTIERVPYLMVHTGLSKANYYAVLASSDLMVTTTIEESFGYCFVEALSLNVPVVGPNAYSHQEIYNNYNSDIGKKYLHPQVWSEYKDYDGTVFTDGIIKVGDHIHNLIERNETEEDLYRCATPYNFSIHNMAKEIKKDCKC